MLNRVSVKLGLLQADPFAPFVNKVFILTSQPALERHQQPSGRQKFLGY